MEAPPKKHQLSESLESIEFNTHTMQRNKNIVGIYICWLYMGKRLLLVMCNVTVRMCVCLLL